MRLHSLKCPILVFVVLVLVLSIVSACGVSTAPRPLNSSFGIAYGGPLFVDKQGSDLTTYLDDVRTFGGANLRFDLEWRQIQPNGPSTYDWSLLDVLVKQAGSRGLSLLPIIDFPPKWAVASGNCPGDVSCVAAPEAYGTFVKAVVQHYGNTFSVLEFGNEPNTKNSWYPKPDPATYVAALTAVHDALAGTGMALMSGGLSPAVNEADGSAIDPRDYMMDLYKRGATKLLKYMAWHPYSFPDLPSTQDAWNSFQEMEGMQAAVTAAGYAYVPIMITEEGAPTCGSGRRLDAVGQPNISDGKDGDYMSPQGQADILVDAVNRYRADVKSGILGGPLFFFTLHDRNSQVGSTSENCFGLRPSGSNGTKPSFDQLQPIINQAA
ncbi:MAG TPA: hypothetical protein VNG90_02790 [Candidatus Acidoferrum sp.]|nr:hypothetical protein [Candidatus Acidoferrum sp.]